MSHSRSLSVTRVGICLIFLAGVAQAGIIPPQIDVRAAISPDPFMSDSYTWWSLNALNALRLNASTYGTTDDPAYYAQISYFLGTQMIGTDFNSWLGDTPPPAGYEDEYGNMLEFPVIIRGNGLRFSLSDVSFTDTFYGKDESPLQLADVGYGYRLTGVDYGADGLPGGSGLNKDIVYDGMVHPGTASTPVDVIYFTGFGAQFYVADPSQLDDAKNKITVATEPWALGTYTLSKNGQVYAGELLLTPEPGTLALAGSGLLLALAALRRRRSRPC